MLILNKIVDLKVKILVIHTIMMLRATKFSLSYILDRKDAKAKRMKAIQVDTMEFLLS